MGFHMQGSGGPWGGGGGPWSGGGGPWSGGPRGGGQGPRGRRPQPPNIEDMLRRGQDQMRKLLPGGFGSGRGIGLVVVIILAIWMASGLYRVTPDELGVVLRFGEFNRLAQPGLRWHLPAPIESVLTPKVTRVNRVEVGFRAEGPGVRGGRQVPEEALMLTGDENIVDINFTVFWVIRDARQYLFNIRNPESTVKAAAESAMREVVGRTPIALALAEGRGQIEQATQKLLQSILDSYKSGIEVTQVQLQKVDPPAPVIDAFRDVQRARADQERLRNEAEAYRNDLLPRARGDAVRIVQEAEAYKQKVVAQAQGEAQRFLSVYEAYRKAPDITTKRLYLETMEDVLKNSPKVIIDKAAEGAAGIVPYLPLPEIKKQASPPRPASQAAQGSSSPPSSQSDQGGRQ
jgi:membrane protease subunit HflK